MVGERGVVTRERPKAGEPYAARDAGMTACHCPHCGGGKLGQWGYLDSGVRRLRCGDCERTFAALCGTVLAGLHDRAAFRLVLDDMMGEVHSSCRALAARLGLDKSTVWRWRKRINAALALGDRERVQCLVDDDVVRLRESRKASREWVNHRQDPARFPAPDRPRWVDVDRGLLPAPAPLARFMVSVHLADDGPGRGLARVLSMGARDDAGEGIWPGSPGVVSASASAIAGASQRGEPALGPFATRGPAATAGASSSDVAEAAVGHQVTSGVRDRFKAFIRPFRGPATRHLDGYAAWFTIGSHSCTESRLATAWTLLLRGGPTEFADIRGGGGDAASAWVTNGWAAGGSAACKGQVATIRGRVDQQDLRT